MSEPEETPAVTARPAPDPSPAVTARPADSSPMADPAEQEPSLLAQLVDIVRYAPIAILLDGPALLPKLAEQGKVHVSNARYLGNKAARQLQPQARRLLGALGEQAAELLKVAGLGPGSDDAADAAHPAPRERRATAPEPAAQRGNGDRNGQAPNYEGPDLDDLAIPGYDSLSASHVLNRLPGLSADELEAVRRYEAGHRGRKTILNRIAQLQA